MMWERENFDLINQGHFRVTDPGPLHAPVQSFSIRRNDKLELILETRAPADAQSSATEHPAGTVRINTANVGLTNLSGIKAVPKGVQSYDVETSYQYDTGQSELSGTSYYGLA